ncbi:MAG: branched-chain amino acid ABC transporter permease [Euzebyaceae bacterium]|jgi:branched-chain amino acid transport system permease protein|nr:branched-chain amino acid ABC transporter permease [Euzebyaceae bacterium]
MTALLTDRGGRGSRPRGRPELYTSYSSDIALLNTPAKRAGVLAIVAAAFALPFAVSDQVLVLLGTGLAMSVGAIGLNIVTGYAGQVSLGHAFFVGLGAYTAAVLSGDPDGRLVGFGLPMVVWLPAAGLVAGAAGLLVAPLATRLRGLYLAIVTLGLVFLGEHVFREWDSVTGGPGVGRDAVQASLFGNSLTAGGAVLSGAQKVYLFALVVLIAAAVPARNLARSGVGRAFAAVRDRDIAAEVIGVSLTKAKLLAFTISSFYAGICGALLYTITRTVEPNSFNLLLSVRFIAMVLIGGAATISGSIMGAMFVTLLPRFTQQVPRFVPFIGQGVTGGGLLTNVELEAMLYGLLIIAFLIFEPRGLFGVWLRVRNYWKGWPFSY